MSYVPTPGPLPGEQWTPSNSDQGYGFIEDWCGKCQRDRSAREGVDLDECDDNEKCEILGASFRGEAVEWRELEDGQTVCIQFVQAGDPVPAPRCEATTDMFGDAP